MADVSVPSPLPESPGTKEGETTLPDYVTSPNAVFDDVGAQWRYGEAPDYSKTRQVWEAGKSMNHAAGSLEQLVENLVKNWEVEASFKPRLQDWRTIDHENYTFAINGGPPQSAEHMLKVGTYNAIIAPNEYYSPENSDFASSHKTFKRMMPTFAWEVVEVYSQPPKVAFKWRHWGEMKNDYVGFNDKGEKITAKAHGGPIEIFGVTVAQVDDKLRLQSVDTWFDPLDMFRRIAPHGLVNKEVVNHKIDTADAVDGGLYHDGIKIAQEHNQIDERQSETKTLAGVARVDILASDAQPADDFTSQVACPFAAQNDVRNDNFNSSGDSKVPSAEAMTNGAVESQANENKPIDTKEGTETTGDLSTNTEIQVQDYTKPAPRSIYSSAVTGNIEDAINKARSNNSFDESVAADNFDAVDQHLESLADQVHPHRKDIEDSVKPVAGEAVAAPAQSVETRETKQEMSNINSDECALILNRE